MQVREAAEEYLASLKRHSKETIKNYRFFLGAFCAWCDQQEPAAPQLEEIRAKVVDRFVDHLRESYVSRSPGKDSGGGISSSTLYTYVKVILSFLYWCLEDEEYSQYVKTATVKRIKKPRVEQKIIEVFSPEQFDALVAATKREYNAHLQCRDRAILAVLVDTGIRADECVTLTIANVSLDPRDAYVRVHGKGNKWREIGLGDKSRRELKTYVRTFRDGSERTDPLFLNRYGKSLTPDGLHQLVHRLGMWSGIVGVRCSPHTFRHTFAVNYLLQGGDIFMLSRLLGHVSVTTTQIYLRDVKAIQARQISKSVLDNL